MEFYKNNSLNPLLNRIMIYFFAFAIESLFMADVSAGTVAVSIAVSTLSIATSVESTYVLSAGIVSFFLHENESPIKIKRNAIFDLISVFIISFISLIINYFKMSGLGF